MSNDQSIIKIPMTNPDALRAGDVYRHYKGGKYRVLGAAKHSESGEELMVYESTSDGEMWVRPVKMFMETVEVDGERIPRFKKI